MKTDMASNLRQTACIRNVIIGLISGFAIMIVLLSTRPTLLGYVNSEELDISVSNFTSLLDKCDSKHKALSVSFEEAKNTGEEAQRKLNECNTISDNMKSEIAAVNIQNKEKVASLTKEVEDVKGQLANSNSQLNDLQKKLDEAMKQVGQKDLQDKKA